MAVPLTPSRLGPIPARAGEPFCVFNRISHGGAYPRSRGGTEGMGLWVLVALGLSPLARGNRFDYKLDDFDPGPIPARAGEPNKLI